MYQIFQYVQQGWLSSYKEIARGVGIDPHKLEAIKNVEFRVFQSGVNPIAKDIFEEIKQQLGGELFTFVNPADIMIIYILLIMDI